MYGAGPSDTVSAKFYEADGLHLKTGTTVGDRFRRREAPNTICPRWAPVRTRKARRKALIPDPRNDENLIVAQTHLAMIRFHNRVVRQAACERSRHPRRVPQARRER